MGKPALRQKQILKKPSGKHHAHHPYGCVGQAHASVPLHLEKKDSFGDKTTMQIQSQRRSLIFSAFILSLTGAAMAQTVPGPVRLMVGYSAGGPVDQGARLLRRPCPKSWAPP